MNGVCPPDAELVALLSNQLSSVAAAALEVHVTDCIPCKSRLEQLTNGGRTLLARMVGLHHSREVTPPSGGIVNETAYFIADQEGKLEGRDAALRPAEPESDAQWMMAHTRKSADAPEKPESATAYPMSFGRYQVRRELGAGGFGTVYLGHDSQLDRPVAIKALRHRGMAAAETEPFLQEARRLARLRHPSIVAVHDVGVHDGQIYIVSDFIDGPNVGTWLRSNRPNWQETAKLIAAVADALAHAHARLTVHRDVKPDNILLTADRVPILVDFGLGLDDSKAGGGEFGIVSGTPSYMSPEQAAGAAHRVDGRTDIYSLGVVLYEMLCGCVPFRAAGMLELLRQVRDDEPQPPRQLAGDIPPELERVCLKALAKRLSDRYTTAADFAQDLRQVIQAAELAPPSSSQRFSAMTPLSSFQMTPPASSQSNVPTLRPSQRRALEAERRQITVLVCGCALFDSEEFLERLDAEKQADLLKEFQQTCERLVEQFGGAVVQCNEQGLVVCFGYPVAYEDAVQRAARTGLNIVENLKSVNDRLRRAHKLKLRPWVGIHTGPAVVEVVKDVVTLVGEARNVAVRLGDVAEPDRVVCSEASHRLIQGHFRFEAFGRHKIKGVTDPVEIFVVVGAGEARGPIEASAPAGLTPLTGRDHEVNLLRDRWEQAQEGMGQVVLITGEAGLGKSRLVYTLKEHVLGQMVEGDADAPVIEWRCAPHFQNTELYPAIDFYERALGFSREDPPEVRFEGLLRRLEAHDLARPETVPLWAALLSLPTPDRFPPLSMSPPRQREATFRAMLEWLHARADRKPLLFVVEDLHWLDASTLEFLGQFLAEGLHDSILTLLTFRPEFHTPWPAGAQHTSLALNRLTRRQVGDLIRTKTGADAPEALIEQIYNRTGGVPLFAEEFTKMVQEAGAKEHPSSGARGLALFEHEVPATLQDLVMARLDRMDGDRELAQLAATLGREFSYEVFAAVAPVDEPTLRSELAKLVQAEILYQKGRPPRCTYIFKHALIEDAAYNSLIKGKRQQFHRRIAEILEAKFPQTVEKQPELLAHHFTEAGLIERGTDYWLIAGSRSQQRSANTEAIGHLTKGLAVLGTLEESAERDTKELRFLTPLGTAYIAARGYAAPEVEPVFSRARELCERIGQPQQLFAIMWGAWVWHLVRADLALCKALAGEAMALADRVNDPGMLMEALFLPGVTSVFRGEFAAAGRHCGRAVADYDDRDRTRIWAGVTGEDSGVAHRCYLSVALWHLGNPDQALKINAEAVELARAIGHRFTLAFALEHRAWLHNQSRLATEAKAAAEEEISLATEQGFAYWLASATLYKAAALVQLDEWPEAIPLLVKGIHDLRATGAGLNLTFHLGFLGDAYTRAGRFEEAASTLDEALTVAERNDERFFDAELYRLKGELMLAECGEPDAAEGLFQKAIEIARQHQSKAWHLRATLSRTRLLQQQGQGTEARTALGSVFATFSEGFTTPDLVDAANLLKALA